MHKNLKLNSCEKYVSTIFLATLVILILSSLTVSSASIAETDGYYITKHGDSVRGKIQIKIRNKPEPKPAKALFGGTVKPPYQDPLEEDVPQESKKIDFSNLTFDFKFSENGEKFKKIDRLKVQGFGFVYQDQQYDFETWDASSNKQIYLMSGLGDVVNDGVYFILRSINGALPIYSLIQKVDVRKPGTARGMPNTISMVEVTKRDIIFKHPTKGYIYISDKYPLKMKFSAALKYLELEEEFVDTLDKKDNLLEVVKKYNKWKSSNQSN